MNEPIEEVYFKWLYSKVASAPVPTPSLTFWTLFYALHSTEFVWLVIGDDNRAMDGLELRRDFFIVSGLIPEDDWVNLGCSVLEMLIAFSIRTEFDTDLSSRDWFWIFLDNIGLKHLCDAEPRVSEKTAEVVDKLIWRTYRANGKGGGLFPLKRPKEDQRKVQIWYQFCSYVVENHIT